MFHLTLIHINHVTLFTNYPPPPLNWNNFIYKDCRSKHQEAFSKESNDRHFSLFEPQRDTLTLLLIIKMSILHIAKCVKYILHAKRHDKNLFRHLISSSLSWYAVWLSQEVCESKIFSNDGLSYNPISSSFSLANENKLLRNMFLCAREILRFSFALHRI